jgi:hypothetical protein
MSEWTDENWEKRHAIVYKCQLSALYHHKRERFYSLCDKITNALALIAGAGAMSELLPSAGAKALAGAFVATITLPGMVFAWADKSRNHALLAAKFVDLQASIEGAGILNAEQLDKFNERAIKLEMEEPPQLSALTRVCQNEIAYALDDKASMTKLTFFEKHFANLFDMPKASAE